MSSKKKAGKAKAPKKTAPAKAKPKAATTPTAASAPKAAAAKPKAAAGKPKAAAGKPKAAGAKPKTAAAKPKAAPGKRKKRLSAEEYVTIGITPPELAEGTTAFELNQELADMDSRPEPELVARVPWMNQEHAYRAGYYLLTHGLREANGHPEIEMCNVPGAMLGSAHDLLTALADYALNEGRFAHGEAMMVSERPLSVIGFLGVKPGERGTDHEADVLRVVFLR